MSDDWMAPFDAARELTAAEGHVGRGQAAAARLMIETIDALAVLARPDGRIIETTRAVMRTTGLGRDEVVGARLDRLPVWRSPGDASLVGRLIASAARGRAACASVEYVPEHRREPHAIWLLMRPVRGVDGEVAFVIAYEQATYGAHVARPADDEPLARQLHRLMEVRRRLVADAMHDLRAPLLGITAAAERLQASDDEDARREGMRVKAAALAALVQTEEMTDLAGLEHRRTQLCLGAVDLAEMVRHVAAVFESVAVERRLELTVDAPSALAWMADAAKVRSVIANLVSNAIRYTPIGGTVRLALREDGDEVVLEVADNGPGIPAGDRSAAFRRSWRGAAGATGHTLGSGVGLSIVKEAVALHQGAVELTRAAEGGTLVVVRLPRRPDAGPRVATSVRDAAAQELATQATVADLRRDVQAPPRRAAAS